MSIRYALVAALCAVLHNVVIIGLDLLGVHYAASSLVSFGVVLSTGFALHCAFTFQAMPTLAGFARYGLAMSANLPLSVAALYLSYDLAGLPMAIASPLATIILFLLNYLLSAWAILPPRSRGAPAEPKEAL